MGVELDRVPALLKFAAVGTTPWTPINDPPWNSPGGPAVVSMWSASAPHIVLLMDAATGGEIMPVGSLGANQAWSWQVLLPPGRLFFQILNMGSVNGSVHVTVVA
jgi:hypothetical protein